MYILDVSIRVLLVFVVSHWQMGSRMTPMLFYIFFSLSSRHEFDSEQIPDLTRDSFRQDIHSVGSLCKLYFRELPNPLLTYQLYDRFSVRTRAVELGQGFMLGMNMGIETGKAFKHREEERAAEDKCYSVIIKELVRQCKIFGSFLSAAQNGVTVLHWAI